MNIEEAIKICKKAKKPMYHEVVGSEWIKGYTSMLGTDLDEAIETLLTAYEKEKEKNKELNWKYTASWVDEHFISKDKIIAKIEEYKKLINECPMNDEEIFCKECTEKCGFNQTIDVLHSLLKEE